MKLFSVAIGHQYEIEAQRLQRSIDQHPVEVFHAERPEYSEVNADPLINGLWHKCNFANYIKQADGAVVFMDADMFTLTDNPFETFSVADDTDLAYVPYEGKWHFPDEARQVAFNHHGHKINSGFMYFRTLEIAQDICTIWTKEYDKRIELYGKVSNINKNEYDEYALMIALMQRQYKVQLLDKKWNDWELSTEDEIRNSNAIFFQSHDHLTIR
jgi:hypothetical protein